MAERMLNDFLIGCDPEFVGISPTGALVNFRNRMGRDGPAGWDHNGWVGEIRPEPSRGTYHLLKKIRNIILELPHFSGIQKLRGGAFISGVSSEGRTAMAIGGHIHLDLNPINNIGGFSEAHLHRVRALDMFTGYLEALDILPKQESEVRRASSQYGKYGDVRVCSEEGHTPRMEYRTMASWIHDPSVAVVCLTGAKLACVDPGGACRWLIPKEAHFSGLMDWFHLYRSKDVNAKRVVDRVLERGHRTLVVPPDEDFRERWRELPC